MYIVAVDSYCLLIPIYYATVNKLKLNSEHFQFNVILKDFNCVNI